MKTTCLLLAALVLASCGKDEAPEPAAAPVKQEPKKDTAADLKKLEGDLPKMDPEKAKYIAVPATPADPAPKEESRPAAPAKDEAKPKEP